MSFSILVNGKSKVITNLAYSRNSNGFYRLILDNSSQHDIPEKGFQALRNGSKIRVNGNVYSQLKG